MRTSIAILGPALLLGAALLRPGPEFPAPSGRPEPFILPSVDPPPSGESGRIPAAFEAPSLMRDEEAKTAGLALSGTTDALREDDGDPTIEAIQRKLETMRVDLAFENAKLEDILAFIRDFSGLNIILDAAVRDKVDPDKAITFMVKDLVLKNVLKLLLSQFQLDYEVTEERVVLLTDFRLTRTSAVSAVSDGGRDILSVLSYAASNPPLTPQEPAAFIESLFIDFDVQNVPMSHALDLLRRGTGVDIRLVEEVEETISFKVVGTSLRAALTLLLQPRNLAFKIENATVWIGRPRK